MQIQFDPVVSGLFVAAVSYALGMINGAIIISTRKCGSDVREHGSVNAGLTNFYRCYGKALAAAVIAIDVLKSVVAALIGALVFRHLGAPLFGKCLAYLFAVVGHTFPAVYGFRGGKGILTSVGAIAVINWRLCLLLLAIFSVIVLATKYVSLGSVIASACIPAGIWLFCGQDWGATILCIVTAALMIWMHRGNIARLLKKQERKLALSH